MKLLKEMGKAVWYMAKAGLIYGEICGGLFALSFMLLGIFIAPSRVTANDIVIGGRAVLLGAALGGGAGVVVGAIDGPVLALLMRVRLPQNQIVGWRRFMQSVNALLTGVGVCIAYLLLFHEPNASSLGGYFIIGCIAGGAFWYATGKYADKVMPVKKAS